MILDEVKEGKWECVNSGRKCPKTYHLMFDDNLLLFGKAVVRQMKKVREMFQKLCRISGKRSTTKIQVSAS